MGPEVYQGTEVTISGAKEMKKEAEHLRPSCGTSPKSFFLVCDEEKDEERWWTVN